MKDPRSRIPSVDALLESSEVGTLVDDFGRPRVVEALREAINDIRGRIGRSDDAGSEWADRVTDPGTYADATRALLEAADVPSLRRVINGTGVVLHTNLGRAALAPEAVTAMQAAAAEYSNLEFDLGEGVRGSRYSHCVSLLTALTGAEDALVVNNAAGALVLALNTIALGEGVAVSRGELVEIGGGFRIPEVLERAGAKLVEVGSTNRTRVDDYRGAFDEEASGHAPPRALLKVHRSNFRITGFTEEASTEELASLGEEQGVPLVHDLGSGLMVDAQSIGLPDEPRAADSLRAGADVVVVSGDKLLGGPQAGLIVGRHTLLARMRKNPLCRALRVDKVTLAGLEATLRLYRDPEEARERIPTLAMLGADPTALRLRAEALADALAAEGVPVEVVETAGAVGGGTFPGVELPGFGIEIASDGKADDFARALRTGTTAVVGHIRDDRLRIDVRTVLAGQEADLAERIAAAWSAVE